MQVKAQFYRDSRTQMGSGMVDLTMRDNAPLITWWRDVAFNFWHMHWNGREWEAWYIARGAI